MDVHEAILTTRAIRRFTDDAVTDDELLTCLRAAVQNFMLAARGLGLGTTLTTVFRIHHDELRALCGIPERHQVVALVPVGRPRGRFGVARRRPPEAVTHWNRFGDRR